MALLMRNTPLHTYWGV